MGQTAQEAQGAHLRRIVKEGRGLVEQDGRRLLCQCLGYHSLLPLPIAQRLHLPVGQFGHACQPHGLIHDAAVIVLQGAPETSVWGASHAHEVAYGESRHIYALGEHHAQQAVEAVRPQSVCRLAIYAHLAGEGRLETSNGAQQRALARSVGTQQAHHIALVQAGIEPACHHAAAIACAHIMQPDFHKSRLLCSDECRMGASYSMVEQYL